MAGGGDLVHAERVGQGGRRSTQVLRSWPGTIRTRRVSIDGVTARTRSTRGTIGRWCGGGRGSAHTPPAAGPSGRRGRRSSAASRCGPAGRPSGRRRVGGRATTPPTPPPARPAPHPPATGPNRTTAAVSGGRGERRSGGGGTASASSRNSPPVGRVGTAPGPPTRWGRETAVVRMVIHSEKEKGIRTGAGCAESGRRPRFGGWGFSRSCGEWGGPRPTRRDLGDVAGEVVVGFREAARAGSGCRASHPGGRAWRRRVLR